MDAPFQPELLLQHGRFVRLLAFHLLRDAHAADDVAQEAWLRMLRQPSLEEGRVRPWLRRVVTNLARNRRRAEANQRARQEDGARPEALPSVVEEFERAELLRSVIEAVLALEEPYRSTILCRYFRGWDAPRLAAETDTSLSTVRSREHRALEKLRAVLDRKEGGRAAWALTLGTLVDLRVPSAIPPAPSLAPSLTSGLATGLGLVALGLGAWLVVRVVLPSSAASSSAAMSTPSAALVAPPPAPSSPALARNPSAREPGGSALTARRSLASATSASSSSPLQTAGTCEVRGRFLLPGGAPAVGVTVHVSGWVGNEERLWDFGAPESWQDPETTSDAEGRFALLFAPPPAYSFELEARLAGFAREKRSWHTLAADEVRDLGEVELLPGGALEGRLLDAQGEPIRIADLEVLADGQRSGARAAPGGRESTWEFTAIDALTGHFRFEDLAPGRVRLGVVRKRNSFLDGPQAVVVAGTTTLADIVHVGPDLGQRVTLSLSTPFFSARPELTSIRLLAPGLEPLHPHTEPSRGHLLFDGLAPGSYTLEIDDPRYLPWSRSDVTPGSVVHARLAGSSALVLDVRDALGNALAQYVVEASHRPEPTVTGEVRVSWPDRMRLHDGKTALPGGRVEGLVAGRYTVRVEVEGLGRRELVVDALQPGETRALSVVFGAQATLGGRVSWPDGAPVAHAEVVLLEPAQEDDSPRSPVCLTQTIMGPEEHSRHELARTESDAAGAFAFALPRAGTYAVYAYQGALDVGSASVTVAEEEHRAVALTLPRGCRIEGRIALPPDAPRGLRVWARRDANEQPRSWIAREAHEATLAADGSFELGPLAAGPAELLLLLPAENLGGFTWSSDGNISGGESLGDVELPEGEVMHAVFDSASSPGAAEVTVLVDGAPAPGLKVRLVTPGDDDEDASAGTDPAGVARMPVFPGTYSVRVEDEDGGWSSIDPAPIVVRAGETSTVLVPLVFVAAELQCVDATTGTPLANQELRLTSPSSGVWPRSQGLRTDSGGRLTLRIPAGEYRLARAEQSTTTTLVWTATGAPHGRIEL